MKRSASAAWSGGPRDANGHSSAESGVLANAMHAIALNSARET